MFVVGVSEEVLLILYVQVIILLSRDDANDAPAWTYRARVGLKLQKRGSIPEAEIDSKY